MRMDAKATPIKQYWLQLPSKSHRTYLSNHMGSISHITPLVINSLGGGYTHKHTYTNPQTKQFQETRYAPAFGWHAPGLKNQRSAGLNFCGFPQCSFSQENFRDALHLNNTIIQSSYIQIKYSQKNFCGHLKNHEKFNQANLSTFMVPWKCMCSYLIIGTANQ